jgi:hypothetical protein
MNGPPSVSDIELPAEVVRQLANSADDQQIVLPLFTMNDRGYPHATLSSARQWWIGDGQLSFVLVAGRTSNYLSMRPEALLLIVGERNAYSVRLCRTVMQQEVQDRRVVVVFDVTAVENDTRGVGLTPMLFRATDELARQERISERTAGVAAQLARGRRTKAWSDRGVISRRSTEARG